MPTKATKKLAPGGKLRSRDPLKLLAANEKGRVRSLLPVRRERMAASPLGFFRGAAAVMAHDLGAEPHSKTLCQLCGDAHLANLGAYAGLDGRLVFDINDFDETTVGPFEWDVKRLTTSILLAGEAARLDRGERTCAAEAALTRYCHDMHKLAAMPILQAARYQVHGLDAVEPISAVLQQAERATPMHSLEQLTELHDGKRRFRTEPPLLRPLKGRERRDVVASLKRYRKSLLPERQHFFQRFRVVDAAFKVVGTGSVGMRAYCLYLQGNGPDDPLFLQIKEEARSVYADVLPASSAVKGNQGKRVTDGQRAMQLESDPLLGWTEIDGRDFLVRQLKDHKATLDLEKLTAEQLSEYAEVCGAVLARGHARSGNACDLAEAIGHTKVFRKGIQSFAEGYVEQTLADWKLLTASTGKTTT